MNTLRSVIAFVLLITLFQFTASNAQERWPDEGDRAGWELEQYRMRAYPFDRIPQNARLDACLYSDWRMRPFSPARGVQRAGAWTPIGPFDVGGRVMSVAVHPTDGRTLWIAAADGGVWKSTDRGAHWNPVMDQEAAIAMGAIAVDPSNPTVLYAGTGEASNFVDSYGGAGVMRSSDGGATWRNVGLRNVGAFARIAAHPRDGRIILAAAIKNNAGLYRSSDAGNTWTRVIARPVTDITINPANPDEIWIGGGESAVMRSTDAGRTFLPSAEGIGTDGAQPARVSVQVAPSAPTVLYALVHEVVPFPTANYSRVYKSTNSGASWDLVMDNDPDVLNYYGHVQGEYNNVIAIQPNNPDVVIVGGVVMLRTTDGGSTWTTIETQLHPDYHALAFDPAAPSRLYIGNDGGMYRSDDAGAAFQRISAGLAITQFYGMAVDQSAPHVTYGGTQDNGTITTDATEYRVGAPGVIGGGDGFRVVVDRGNPDIVYFEQPYGAVVRATLSTKAVQNYTQGIASNDRGAWSAPLVADPADSTALYCGRTRVYRRTSSTSWKSISPPFRTPIATIAVSSVDARIIYAGSGMDAGGSILISDGVPLGELKVTTDGGSTWADRTLGLPNRVITDMVTSEHDTCTAYAAFSGFAGGHLFKTTDCGRSWSDIGKGLPDIPVNALALDPDDERIIYAGTDIGMYITTDGGANWWTYNNGLPRAAVVDLEIHRSSHVLRAATHGRSMWEIPLITPEVSAGITSPTGRDLWMGGSRRLVTWSGLTPPLRLEYSVNGGALWASVADNIGGNSYLWTVPDIESNNVLLRVRKSADSVRSAVSEAFGIERRRAGGVLAAAGKPVPCWGLAYDGEFLWATVENSDTLLRMDPLTLATLAIVKVQGEQKQRFTDITWHPVRGTFFMHEVAGAAPDVKGNAGLLEVAKDGTVLHRWASPCYYPTGLAWLPNAEGGVLLASDLFGGQELYLIDPNDGTVKRTIVPGSTRDLGPAGIAAAADGRTFWRVIDDFDFNSGPRGSGIGAYVLGDSTALCGFSLVYTPDSTQAGGYQQWGKLFARGVERDPADGNLWVTNLDGAIYKVVACDAVPAGVPAPSTANAVVEMRVRPNPLAVPSHVTLVLAHAATISLDLYDNAGRAVAAIASGRFEAGTHEVPLRPVGLPSGVYRCRLAVEGGQTLTQGVVWVR